MKLKPAQSRALQHCDSPHWTGVLSHPETVIRSLLRRGLIERGPMSWVAGQTYRITEAGRRALASAGGEEK